MGTINCVFPRILISGMKNLDPDFFLQTPHKQPFLGYPTDIGFSNDCKVRCPVVNSYNFISSCLFFWGIPLLPMLCGANTWLGALWLLQIVFNQLLWGRSAISLQQLCKGNLIPPSQKNSKKKNVIFWFQLITCFELSVYYMIRL